MIALNSRDWSEIVWLPEISHFKINLAISFIRKKPAGMHWLGYNDAVSSLNEAKTQIFQPTANFKNLEIRLYFVSQPAVRPGCARCRAPEISHDKAAIDFSQYFQFNTLATRPSHSLTLNLLSSTINAFRHSFFVTSPLLWNSIPFEILSQSTAPIFKFKLKRFLFCT